MTAAPSSPPPRPKVVRATPLPPPRFTWHRLRKAVHAVCFAVFVLLPFSNLMRLDIPRARFYVAGQELWISEFGIIFFTLMFLLFLVAGVSILYGRFYCAYMCPQMIFSEASTALEARIRRFTAARFSGLRPATRRRVAHALFLAALVPPSIFLAFVFTSYFVEPRDLLGRLLAFDIRTAGGIAGATTTLVTWLDFTFVRQRFCTTVCPYGYLQGMLADTQTLLIEYRDGTGAERVCIDCGKCVRVCEMHIDIRDSAHQIECIHCGECIDACDEVLGKLGKPGLIHYAWGSQGATLAAAEPWYAKLGLRDAKRIGVLLVLLFYGAGLSVALAMRHPVLVAIAPDRTTMFTRGERGEVLNTFRLTLANRSRVPATVAFEIRDLPGARLVGLVLPVAVAPGQETRTTFRLAVDPGALPPGVNHFTLVSRSDPDGATTTFPLTFITPTAASRARP